MQYHIRFCFIYTLCLRVLVANEFFRLVIRIPLSFLF